MTNGTTEGGPYLQHHCHTTSPTLKRSKTWSRSGGFGHGSIGVHLEEEAICPCVGFCPGRTDRGLSREAPSQPACPRPSRPLTSHPKTQTLCSYCQLPKQPDGAAPTAALLEAHLGGATPPHWGQGRRTRRGQDSSADSGHSEESENSTWPLGDRATQQSRVPSPEDRLHTGAYEGGVRLPGTISGRSSIVSTEWLLDHF